MPCGAAKKMPKDKENTYEKQDEATSKEGLKTVKKKDRRHSDPQHAKKLKRGKESRTSKTLGHSMRERS